MLQDDRVAECDVGRGETGHLVVREVPRHDAHEGSDGFGADHSPAGSLDVQGLFAEEAFGIVRVVVIDGGDEGNLSFGFRRRLAYFEGQQGGQFVGAFAVQFGHPGEDGSSFGKRDGAPFAVFREGTLEYILYVLVAEGWELGNAFSGCRVGGCIVAHRTELFLRQGRLS